MSQVTEAIYSHGVLKPLGDLGLRELQRVRVTVEPIDDGSRGDRAAALERLRTGIQSMNVDSEGRMPAREELHDRS